MEIFTNIIWWINIFSIIFVLSAFFMQILFACVPFLKPRKYPKAKKYHDFTVIIRACNEEDVIADSVDSALAADYPSDKKHVIVFCHNCTDKTAEIARAHGARTIEFTDMNLKHRKASYCMKLGMDRLAQDPEGTYEYFLFIDADNQVDKNYFLACNDAADDGVLLGRTFENSKNLTDNVISCMTGLWYLRDNSIACNARSAMNLGCVMDGCASMVKAEYALHWDAMSSSDDLEFTLNRLLKDHLKVEYISEAMVYEDQPTSLHDMFARNTRMGGGLNKLFWSTGIKCFVKFLKALFDPKEKFSQAMTYLDMYCNSASIPMSLYAVAWFVPYYVFVLIYTGLGNTMNIVGVGQYGFRYYLIAAISVVVVVLFLFFYYEILFGYLVNRKKIVVKKKSVLVFSILLYPLYILIDIESIIVGIFSKGKWKKLKRSKTKIDTCEKKKSEAETKQ